MKIIGICGSPHVNGNTAKLIKVEFISLGDRELSLCKACYECLRRGECILND